jgi:hypothetical protein
MNARFFNVRTPGSREVHRRPGGGTQGTDGEVDGKARTAVVQKLGAV